MKYYDILVDPKFEGVIERLGYSKLGVGIQVLDSNEIDMAYARDKLVFVKSSNSLEKNRRILKSPCDGIVDPVFPRLLALDYPAMTIAKDNDCSIILTLSNLEKYTGIQRANYLSRTRLLVKMATKKRLRVILTTGASSEFQLRTPIQLISFGKVLGMTDSQAKRAIGPAVEHIRRRVYDTANSES